MVQNDTYRVKKISLLYTDLTRPNGERVYIPNASLLSLGITNLTRSKNTSQSVR
jgi:small-conductance mechanosensitive channel